MHPAGSQGATSIHKLFDLSGRLAVITGGAGFLGRQHASALAEAGAEVVLWDVEETKLNEAVQELSAHFPGQISGDVVDISLSDSIGNGAKRLRTKGIHILVNNASLTVARGTEKFKGYFDPFEVYPLDLWRMALEVNLTGTFLVTQQLCSLLVKNPGIASIINIASDVGVISPDHRIYQANSERDYKGVGFNTPLSYATSKAALIHMTKYWATYWAKDGIRVNAISPAGVANNQDSHFVRELMDRIPLGRMAEPHELKGAILYLASDASSFMTGANLVIDGGRTIW